MTRHYPLLQVDAFTNTPLEGNPCAVVLDADDLTPAEMLAIAREMNLSETAFVLRSEKADVRARYFTPAEEIPLAGHPTLATTQALLDTRRLMLRGDAMQFRLELNVGVIAVDVTARVDGPPIITMTQKPPQFLRIYDPAEATAAFNLTPDDLVPGSVVQTVSTGTPQIMFYLRDHAALRRAHPDTERYVALRTSGDFFSPHLFAPGGITAAAHVFARHFGIPPDSPEDPFTGSATGGMAAYLVRYGYVNAQSFAIEQGHWMGRPGRGFVELTGTPGHIESVRVGGQAVTVFEGVLRLP
ncbi:MAG: PhzF family phenazine biosynthesis protein [Anaerolineae bacterium]